MLESFINNEDTEPDLTHPKKYLKVLAVISPALAALGFIALTIPLLGFMAIFNYNSVFYEFLALSPYLATTIELIAIVIGIVTFKKLPKKLTFGVMLLREFI